MRGMWLFYLCVFLLASPAELLVIDNFETEKLWEPMASAGCTINVFPDRVNVKEGQASLRLEVQFSESCDEGKCYAGIGREAPDLTGYAFLRLWVKVNQPVKALFGLYVESADGKGYIYAGPLDKTGWILMNAPFSEFASEGEQSKGVNPGSIETLSLIVAADEPLAVTINVDGLVALTDTNGNGIPDADETTIVGAAENSEQMGDKYFEQEDYQKAAKYYGEAMSMYQQLGNLEKAQEMDSKVRESKAWAKYKEAEDLYQQKLYGRAAEAYEEARKLFVVVGNVEMVDTIENRLKELSELTGKTVPPLSGTPYDRPQRAKKGGVGGLIFVLIVVCVVGAGVYVWKFRGQKPEPEKKELLSPSEAKAEEIRKLKAKFVFGEINRSEYDKKLRELENKK